MIKHSWSDGRLILRAHAVFLILLTLALTSGASLGYFTGRGPYGGLVANPEAFAGLAQAYPLMCLVAVALWFGSRSEAPMRYSFLAIAAHCVPLSVLAILWEPISTSSIAPPVAVSFLIHGAGIVAELYSMWLGYAEFGARDGALGE